MFTDPSTLWIEILVIIASIAFVATILGIYIYKKKHHIPTGDCACCHKNKKQLLKKYHKYCNCKK